MRNLRYILGEQSSGPENTKLAMAMAFAAVREAARRAIGHTYGDTDIVAGAALYSGQAAAAKDEGSNHLIAMLPMYLCAALREDAHYVTTTPALASHYFRETESICTILGLRSRLLSGTAAPTHDNQPPLGSDIIFGSYREFAYSYLGNHLRPDPPELIRHQNRLAVVDQIDFILIDQAAIPLVIRAPKLPDADFYHKVAAVASQLTRGTDYQISSSTGSVSLTGDGLTRGAALLRTNSLDGLEGAVVRRYLEDGLRAGDWYRRGLDYQVTDMKVVVNTEPGSRLAGNPRLEEGIRQAIEAREGLATSAEQAVWARITVAGYFQTYPRLCGISGLADRASGGLERMYGLRTVSIPGSLPPTRVDHPDLAFEEATIRLEALIREATRRHRNGQPVVIGVMTAEDGELAGAMLDDKKIPYSAVLAGDDESSAGAVAAAAVAQAGQPGSVTIVTAAATRGLDITLDGGGTSGPNARAGLLVLLAGRSRSWRSDEWLRSLAGRRGDPGESQFFLSYQDPVLRGLHSRAWNRIPARIRRRADGAPLTSVQVHVIEETRRKIAERDFERLLDQQAIEHVENHERANFYSWREELLQEGGLRSHISELIDEVAWIYVERYKDPEQLLSALARLYPTRLTISDLTMLAAQVDGSDVDRNERVKADAHAAYDRHEQFLGPETMRTTERQIISSLLSSNWSRQLSALEAMRTIPALGLSQRDWLSAYSDEANRQYAAMVERLKEDIVGHVLHSEPTGASTS
jgi:preprotein translocase subunit SecA